MVYACGILQFQYTRNCCCCLCCRCFDLCASNIFFNWIYRSPIQTYSHTLFFSSYLCPTTHTVFLFSFAISVRTFFIVHFPGILWLWSSDPICLCTNLLLLAAILADKQYHNFTKCFFSPLLADKKTPHSLIKVLNEMLIDMREKRTLIACWHANNGFVQGGESVLFPLVG